MRTLPEKHARRIAVSIFCVPRFGRVIPNMQPGTAHFFSAFKLGIVPLRLSKI
ncbi:hypothetical protein B4099_0380 [Heyndrickxia coagulans]|uniref:Uncharacterized protein n=1 Tax=Heyndrickxia coagulans TaxID=1398 RepID=A0A150KDL2_HEYCO|nr:hypothetical protein B4099_0380 [Heyndrickxia coagulans]